jgi:hypothetical protein
MSQIEADKKPLEANGFKDQATTEVQIPPKQ